MNAKNLVRVVAIGILLAALLVIPARAAGPRTEFTGSETCDDSTFQVLREFASGISYHVRGITQTCYDTASIPELTGTDYLSGGLINFAGNAGVVTISGKLRMVSDEGGVWVGNWDWPLMSPTIRVVARGEGKYEGMILFWFLEDTGGGGGPFHGYIIKTNH